MYTQKLFCSWSIQPGGSFSRLILNQSLWFCLHCASQNTQLLGCLVLSPLRPVIFFFFSIFNLPENLLPYPHLKFFYLGVTF